jgi:hypothetical protein
LRSFLTFSISVHLSSLAAAKDELILKKLENFSNIQYHMLEEMAKTNNLTAALARSLD